jgi:hypothetical protein
MDGCHWFGPTGEENPKAREEKPAQKAFLQFFKGIRQQIFLKTSSTEQNSRILQQSRPWIGSVINFWYKTHSGCVFLAKNVGRVVVVVVAGIIGEGLFD